MKRPQFKPDPHQAFSLAHASQNSFVLDFSDAGTGKTPVALWAYEKMRERGERGAMLVLCPRTLTVNVWASSVKKFTPQFTCSVAKAENREAAFAVDADIYITNTDAATWLAKQPKKFFDRSLYLVVDESSAYKHHTSQRSKALAKIRKYFQYRRLMSGTPMTRSITDIWHQAFIADDGKRLGNSFYAFRNSVCTPVQVGASPNAIRWEDREGAEEAVFSLLSDIVVRHRFDDVVTIPERQVYTVGYELTRKHMKTYADMERHQFTVFQEKAKKGPASSVSAVHAAALRQKLLQIASGAVYADQEDQEKPTLVLDTGRYELVMDLALESPHSLIMFLWRHQRDQLVEQAEKRGLSFVVLDGHTPDHIREQIEADYQAGKYDVVIAHPQTVAHGLTLTRGTTTVWASPTDNTEWFKQGNRRQARRGQTQATRVVTVIAPGTVDEAAYANCIGKGQREDQFLGLFEKFQKEEFTA